MKLSTILPVSILVGAIAIGAAGTVWQHYGCGSASWPVHEADGHYECHKLDRHHLCFWIGEKREDGRYIIRNPAA